MTKTFLSILMALVFVFGAAGFTVAAAKQNQPGEPLYGLRTWSAQIFREPDTAQIRTGQVETGSGANDRTGLQDQEKLQMQLRLHEQNAIHQTPESPALHHPDDHSGMSNQGGNSNRGTETNHEGDHTHQEQNGNSQQEDGNDHGHD